MSDVVEDLRYAEHVIDERVMKVMDSGADEIESLRRQLAEKDAEITRLKREDFSPERVQNDSLRLANTVLHEQLAASQAREVQLREAVRHNDEWQLTYDPYDGYISSDIASINGLALSLPTDTSALEAMIAKAGERMRERCAAIAFIEKPNHDLLERVRALPGVTLEDLQK